MTVPLSDKEQKALLVHLWREYGLVVVGSVLLVLIGSFCWRTWQNHMSIARLQASNAYELLLNDLSRGDHQAVNEQAQLIIKDYPKTAYAKFAALLLARDDIEQGELEQGEHYLAWVVANAKSPAIVQVARIRQARVLSALHRPEQALEVLSRVTDKLYLPLANEVEGDIYASQGDKEKAKVAYESALQASPQLHAMRPVLEMKLNDVSTAVA